MFAAFAVWFVTMVLDIGAGTALGAFLVTATTIVITTGLSMAATRLLAPKMPSYSDLAGRGVMTRNPVAARQIVYGQTKCSGPIVYLATSGAKNQFLHIVVALAGHQVEEIGDVYFNEDLVLTGAGDGYGTGIFSNCLIHKKLGTTTQTVDTTLEADFPTDWDSTHRLRGIAYIYVKLTYSAEVFPGGIPNVSAVVKGKLVYNLVTATTIYSKNPAYCLRDYLTDTDLGMGMTTAEVDDTACAAAATVCDVAVAHLPSGTEARYECSGQAVTSSTPDAIIGQLLSSMAGNIAYSGGKVVMYAGAYRTPTVTLTEAHLAGAVSVTTRASARDRVNAVKGTYISAANQWAAADFPSIYSSTYTTEDNGITHWRDVVLPFTTSSSAAQRIAVINLRQARQEIVFSAKFNLNAMQLRAGDTVMVTNAKFGWTAKVFEVIEWALANDGTPPQPVIAMTLRETDSTVYDWDVGDEVAVESAPNTDLPDPFTVADPTSLSLRSDETTAYYQRDGAYVPRVSITWVAPSDEFVQSGGKVQVQYKPAAVTTAPFVDWSLVPGDQTQEYLTDVNSGVLYTIALYSINFFGVTGAVITANVTASTNNVAPATPTGLTAVVGTGKAVSIDWADNAELDLSEYGVYRSESPAYSVPTIKIAEVRASRFVDTDVVIGTTYHYSVSAIDRTELESSKCISVTATPSAVAASATDATPPSTPDAFSMSGTQPGAYLSDDGTVFTRLQVTLPAMPTGGVVMNLLYKLQSGTHYLIAGQYTAGSVDAIIDDLTPGEYYTIAVQAFSAFGVGSTVRVVTGTDALAPVSTALPNGPASMTATAPGSSLAIPAFFDVNGFQWYGCKISWPASTSKDVVAYEWAFGATDGALDSADKNYTADLFGYAYIQTLVPAYVGVRSVNATGTRSTWTKCATNLTGVCNVIAGTMSEQDANAVTVTGGTITGITDIALADGGTGASTASAAATNLGLGTADNVQHAQLRTNGLRVGSAVAPAQNPQAIGALYSLSTVISLAGGAASEVVTVSITNTGFTTKPDWGFVQVYDTGMSGVYDFDTGSDASVASFVIYKYDGTALPNGSRRYNFLVGKYS